MCDFKVGDEVVCVRSDGSGGLIEGKKYRVSFCERVYPPSVCTDCGDYTTPDVMVEGCDPRPKYDAYCSCQFSLSDRRDLTEWLSSSVGNTDKIDKRKRVNA